MTRFKLKKQIMQDALRSGEQVAYTLCFVNPIFNALEIKDMQVAQGYPISVVAIFYSCEEVGKVLSLIPELPDNVLTYNLSLSEVMQLEQDKQTIQVYIISEEEVRQGENLKILYDIAEGASGPMVYLVNTAKHKTTPVFKKNLVDINQSPFVRVLQEEQAIIADGWGKKYEDKQSSRTQKVNRRILSNFIKALDESEERFNKHQEELIISLKENANKQQQAG